MVARGFRLGSRLILCSFSADASAPSAYTIGHLRWPGVQFLQSRTASSHARGAFSLADGTSLHWHDPCKSEDRVKASRHRWARRRRFASISARVCCARARGGARSGHCFAPHDQPSLQAVIDRVAKIESDVGQALRLPVQTLPQPDETTCGPTCLHAVYRYWGDTEPLDTIIARMYRLERGGTFAVFLGCDALRKGYCATIYTYNVTVFDPTWF